MVAVTLKGSKALKRALKKASPEVRENVGDVVMATAIKIRANAVKSIQEPGTGTLYFRIYDPETGYTTIYAGDSEGFVVALKGQQNLSPTHRASAEGEAPATDTGRLVNSIYFEAVGPLTATVGSNLDYANWLEFGTIAMGARPFMRPAVEKERAQFREKLEAALADVTK